MVKKHKQGECLVAIAHDKQTGENRSIMIPIAMMPKFAGESAVMDMYGMGAEPKTIEHMIKQKIAKDGDLIGMDQFHFINWCTGYISMPKEEQTKLQVEAIVRSFNNLEDAENMLKRFKEAA